MSELEENVQAQLHHFERVMTAVDAESASLQPQHRRSDHRAHRRTLAVVRNDTNRTPEAAYVLVCEFWWC